MTTYTRLEAAETFGVSNTIISRNLKALVEMGFGGLLNEDNRLTERAIYLIGLYRNKDFSMLDEELEADRLALDPLQSDVCDHPAEAEVFGTYPAEVPAAAGSLTLATTCQTIADRTGTIAATSSVQYQDQAAAAKSALAQFVAKNNQRSHQLASNAAEARKSFAALGQQHALGHLMTYAESLNSTLTEGMAAMQNGAVGMADQMGKHAAEAVQ